MKGTKLLLFFLAIIALLSFVLLTPNPIQNLLIYKFFISPNSGFAAIGGVIGYLGLVMYFLLFLLIAALIYAFSLYFKQSKNQKGSFVFWGLL